VVIVILLLVLMIVRIVIVQLLLLLLLLVVLVVLRVLLLERVAQKSVGVSANLCILLHDVVYIFSYMHTCVTLSRPAAMRCCGCCGMYSWIQPTCVRTMCSSVDVWVYT